MHTRRAIRARLRFYCGAPKMRRPRAQRGVPTLRPSSVFRLFGTYDQVKIGLVSRAYYSRLELIWSAAKGKTSLEIRPRLLVCHGMVLDGYPSYCIPYLTQEPLRGGIVRATPRHTTPSTHNPIDTQPHRHTTPWATRSTTPAENIIPTQYSSSWSKMLLYFRPQQ